MSSRADAKLFSGNSFFILYDKQDEFFFGLAASDLFFLPRRAKSSLSKFKSLIFVGSISFLHGSNSFVELLHDGFVKPVGTAASTQNIAAAT